MGEDAACVEMSLLREQKTTNNSTRKIMTLADMRMANMNECSPQFSHICVSPFALALALTCGPSVTKLQSPRSKIKSIMAKGTPQPDPDCRPL